MAELEIHASAIAIAEAGIVIRGASGSGKSRLALALIEVARCAGVFARLVGDDRIRLENAQRTADRERPSPDPRPDRAKGRREFCAGPSSPPRWFASSSTSFPPLRRRAIRPPRDEWAGWTMRRIGISAGSATSTSPACACPCSSRRIRRLPPTSPAPCCAISGPTNPSDAGGGLIVRAGPCGAIVRHAAKENWRNQAVPDLFHLPRRPRRTKCLSLLRRQQPHRPRLAALKLKEIVGNQGHPDDLVISELVVRRFCRIAEFPHGAACFEPSNLAGAFL